jgi:hypothetical protein
MSQPNKTASEAERKAFAQKLGQFRSTLPAQEQRMLDSLVLCAEGAQPGDVQGYTAIFGTDATMPEWYAGLLPPAETSPWWQNYNTPWS